MGARASSVEMASQYYPQRGDCRPGRGVLWQALGVVAALLPMILDSVLGGIRVLVPSALLFLMPGYVLLALARLRMAPGPLEGLIVFAGLSVAVVPLLLYLGAWQALN